MNTVVAEVSKRMSRVHPHVDGMDVPVGYKQTEVGTIPVDWQVQTLGSCLQGAPRYGVNAPAVPLDDRLPTYIRITDISDDHRFRPNPRVSVSHPRAEEFRLSEGDLVFARTGATVGKSYQYDPRDGDLVWAGFLVRVRPNPTALIPDFLRYVVQSKRYWDWVATHSIRSGQPGINANEYGTLPLQLPTLGEQRAIAEALSDVDELLNALEELIAKKQAIKQAAMQQLLTGRTRLPGFSGEWETRRLGDLGSTYGGLVGKRKADFGNGSARYVTFLNVLENVAIDPEGVERVQVAASETQNPVRKGDVLFNGTSETPEDLAMAAVVEFDDPPLYLNSFCFGFRLQPRGGCVARFLAYHFRGFPGRNAIQGLAQGATRYNLSKSQFRSISLSLPPIEEQTAIATVLADMDDEIAALERRHDKTRAIKEGMMQQLLTGRVRLVEPEEME